MSIALTDEQKTKIRGLVHEIIERWRDGQPFPPPLADLTPAARWDVSLMAYALASTEEFETE